VKEPDSRQPENRSASAHKPVLPVVV
jgi:hypothetical protein